MVRKTYELCASATKTNGDREMGKVDGATVLIHRYVV